MNIHIVLEKYFSDKKYAMRGDTYEGLEWFDELPQPTRQELQDLWDKYTREEKYLDDRKTALKEDYLTPMVWVEAFLKKEVDKDPSDWDALVSRRETIKEATPEPVK